MEINSRGQGGEHAKVITLSNEKVMGSKLKIGESLSTTMVLESRNRLARDYEFRRGRGVTKENRVQKKDVSISEGVQSSNDNPIQN